MRPLTARSDPAAKPVAAAFRERLGALARAHEYVRPHSPDSAPAVAGQTVLGLMRLLMAAYVEDGRERVAITGDDVEIGEQRRGIESWDESDEIVSVIGG